MNAANSIYALLLGNTCLPAAETSAESLMGLSFDETDQSPDGRMVTLDPFHPGEAINFFLELASLGCLHQHHRPGAHGGLMAIVFEYG